MSELMPGLIRFELMIFLVLEVRLKKFWVGYEGVGKGVAERCGSEWCDWSERCGGERE